MTDDEIVAEWDAQTEHPFPGAVTVEGILEEVGWDDGYEDGVNGKWAPRTQTPAYLREYGKAHQEARFTWGPPRPPSPCDG